MTRPITGCEALIISAMWAFALGHPVLGIVSLGIFTVALVCEVIG